jgi:hypothetical protein
MRYRPGKNELQHYLKQKRQAEVANYRVAWLQGRGYIGQVLVGDTWESCNPDRFGTYPEAILDCKLNARESGKDFRLHPLIANLTPGRPEYHIDLTTTGNERGCL